jgi:hypothetical protein
MTSFLPASSYPVAPYAPPYAAPYMAPTYTPYTKTTTIGPSGTAVNLSTPTSSNTTYYPTTNQKTYFVQPPFVSTRYYKYTDVNDDELLQEKETDYFLAKTINWINTDSRFKTSKKYLSKLKNEEGYHIIHKILKLFVRKGNTNWYDLKVQKD